MFSKLTNTKKGKKKSSTAKKSKFKHEVRTIPASDINKDRSQAYNYLVF